MSPENKSVGPESPTHTIPLTRWRGRDGTWIHSGTRSSPELRVHDSTKKYQTHSQDECASACHKQTDADSPASDARGDPQSNDAEIPAGSHHQHRAPQHLTSRGQPCARIPELALHSPTLIPRREQFCLRR